MSALTNSPDDIHWSCVLLSTNLWDQTQTTFFHNSFEAYTFLSQLPLMFCCSFPQNWMERPGYFSSKTTAQSPLDSHTISGNLVLSNLTLGLPTWQGRSGASKNRRDLKWNRKYVVYSSLLHLPHTRGVFFVFIPTRLLIQSVHLLWLICASRLASVYVLGATWQKKKKSGSLNLKWCKQRSRCVFQDGASGWHQESLADW